MVQLELGDTEDPQLLVWEYWADAIEMLVIESAPLPLLVMVTGCEWLLVPWVWLPKFRLVGDTEGTTPLPLSVTLKLPALAVFMESTPVIVPVVVGLNTTLIVQLEFGGTEVPQLRVCENWADAIEMLAIESTSLLVFVTVTA
jgi:hypothetical protein